MNDRVSVEYRAKAKRILFVTALGVTLLLNADTFQMANRLVKDDALRKVVTQDAVALAAMSDDAPAAREPGKVTAPSPSASSFSTPAGAASNPSDRIVVAGSLDRLDLPLRWTRDDWDTLKGIANYSEPEEVFNGLYKVIGLIVTALALTMGAEFWYNLLKQLVPAIRGQNEDESTRRASRNEKS